ncbi:MAG: hypothetical protein JSV51_06445 [Candidatus Bathyarchaeota archaeon]|nr:MAG: hypothetical protein JSV51_06445 [Candidatus Bathyarchaeota archaeon]
MKAKEEDEISTFPQALTIRYFQLVNNRQLTEAQRQLQRIKQKARKTQWDDGYCEALQGLLLAQKTNGNQYTFLQNLNSKDITTIRQHREDFLKHVNNRFQEDYDRGFFSAWADYTQLLIKTIIDSTSGNDVEGQTSIIQYAESTRKPA